MASADILFNPSVTEAFGNVNVIPGRSSGRIKDKVLGQKTAISN